MNPAKMKLCIVCSSPIKNKSSKGTCSYSCSNVAFRSGEDNGNFKDAGYVNICKRYYPSACLVCGEKEVIDIHHIDCNRENNSPNNLIPLCPTHHAYMHRGKQHLIIDVINSKLKDISDSPSLAMAARLGRDTT